MRKFKLAHIIFIVAFIFVFLLLPKSVTTPSQYGNTVFVVGLGLDKGEQQNILLSAQIVAAKPNAASSESYQIVSAEGVDLLDSIENLRKQMGKILGLSHCYVVVVSDDICNTYNLTTLLDPLVRTERLGTNVILAHTENKAQELLLACEEIGGNAQNVLESLTKYNHKYILNKDASIYDFYKDYLSPTSTGMIVTINHTKQESLNNNSNSQQKESGKQEQTNTMPQNKIQNVGKGVAFYNGKKVATVPQDILRGLGWLDNSSRYNNIKLEHINTKKLKDATVTLNQKNYDINFKASINNNTPTLYITLDIKAKIVGIESPQVVSVSDVSGYYDSVFCEALQTIITKEVDAATQFQQENKLDILNYYKIFNTQLHNEWQEYLNTLNDKREYTQNIQLFVKTSLTEAN